MRFSHVIQYNTLTFVSCGFCFVCVRSTLTAVSIVVCRGLVLLLCETTDSTLLEDTRIAVNIICLLVAIHYMFLLCIVVT